MNAFHLRVACIFAVVATAAAQQCFDPFSVFTRRVGGAEPSRKDGIESIDFAQGIDLSECDATLELTGTPMGDVGMQAIIAGIENDEDGHCPRTIVLPSCKVCADIYGRRCATMYLAMYINFLNWIGMAILETQPDGYTKLVWGIRMWP